jgi:SAM-dependent methyltransferase
MADRPLGYTKLCEVGDFAHPDLAPLLRAIFRHELDRFGADFPRGREYRKHWEVAMAVRALGALGALHPAAELLGVGVGNEPTLFWLTTQVGRVYATDLYCAGGDWAASANATMLRQPGRHWPGPWNRRRLVVQHMNALDLHYEDGSFDGVFSSSSLEHFGTLDDVGRSLREMYRVLKPGGVLALSTEFRLEGPPPGLPNILLFDEPTLRDVLESAGPWEAVGPWDLNLSAATRAAAVPFAAAAADVRRHVAAHDGQLVFHRLDWSQYPHVVLREGERAWTSIHVTLRKPAARDRQEPGIRK